MLSYKNCREEAAQELPFPEDAVHLSWAGKRSDDRLPVRSTQHAGSSITAAEFDESIRAARENLAEVTFCSEVPVPLSVLNLPRERWRTSTWALWCLWLDVLLFLRIDIFPPSREAPEKRPREP